MFSIHSASIHNTSPSMGEVARPGISGQSMHKLLPIWFANRRFSSLQPHWIGGDGYNDTLVLFVRLHKFSALLV